MKSMVIYSSIPSDWFSCVSITQNLISMYKRILGNQYLEMQFDEKNNNFDYIGETLKNKSIKNLVFIDHSFSFLSILIYLKEIHFELLKNININIHVFGDYSINAYKLYSFKAFEGLKLRWIAASIKQKILVQSTLKAEKSVEYYPFLVDSDVYHYRKLKIKNYYVYTGRISTQKNVILLCEYFSRYCREKRLKSKLKIYGRFDDIGVPFFDYKPVEGFSVSEFTYKILDNPKVSPFIEYCGFVNENELSNVLSQSLGYISLSTYHDEDFGMSVAESLCSGTPCLLTDWAGYSSFNISDNLIHYVDVNLRNEEIDISYENFEKAFDQLRLDNRSNFERNKLSLMARSKYTINGDHTDLIEMLNKNCKRFKGFNFNMKYLAESKCKFKLSNLKKYKEIYGCYFTKIN